MGKRFICICLSILLVFSLTLAGCGQSTVEKDEEEDSLQIVASISILSDLVENIIGDRGTVEGIVPMGDNPEDYELLSSDMQKISNADIFFLNGWHVEEAIERSLGNLSDTKTVHLTEGIEPIPLVGEDTPDPHAWLDAQLIKDHYVENILTALIEVDPEGEDLYRQNATAYKEQLQDLDTWIKEVVAEIPQENRIIVVSENAYKYYGEAYGFQTEGIWELNSHEEGTPQQIARIVNLVQEENIPAIFVETTLDDRYMRTIESETGVPIAGEVYTDALGMPGSGAETYIEMMKHNTNTFIKGLAQ